MTSCLERICLFAVYILFLITLPLGIWFCFKAANEFERAIIFRFGRLKSGGPKGPGLFFILPCIDMYFIIDLRVVTYNVPPQEILTKDAVTIYVNAVIYYKVVDPLKAVMKISDYSNATEQLGATYLRNELGTKKMSEILTEKEEISNSMQLALDEATDPWGIKVNRVEIKDVSLPESMQRAMAAEGEATREARAKVIAAEGELNAARSLKDASDIIASNPAALQLRYLQTLNAISVEQNQTIVFPLPMDILDRILR